MRHVLRRAAGPCAPFDLDMVLDQNAVVQDGDGRRLQKLACAIEPWRMIDDVISLPFARPAAGVDQRRLLLIDRCRLPVVVGLVIKGIEHLNLVTLLQINPAVATALALAFDLCRRRPFHVQLAVSEGLPGGNTPGAVDRCHALLYLPPGRAAVFLTLPLR